MVYLIFILVVSLIAGVLESTKNCYKQFFWSVFWEEFSGAAIISLIICIVFSIFAFSFVTYPNHHSEINRIECLADNNTTSGSFFLGCGEVEGRVKFAYYQQTKTGFKLETIDTDQVFIVYTKEKPYVEYVYKDLDPDSFWNYFIPVTQLYATIFHVPYGSINNKYNLNAE